MNRYIETGDGATLDDATTVAKTSGTPFDGEIMITPAKSMTTFDGVTIVALITEHDETLDGATAKPETARL